MPARIVKLLGSLLLDPELGPEAKVLRMVLALEPERRTVAGLAQRAGISEPMVRKGRALLETLRWGEERGWASIPSELVLDAHIAPLTRIMYGILQLTPRFEGNKGRFRYIELSALAGVCANTAKRAIRELHEHRWIHLYQEKKSDPIGFRLLNPHEDRRQAEVEEARLRLSEARHKVEALMREFLTLMVDSDEFEDDAAPGFLVNPSTGGQLEFDRYYPPHVAFELNGPQHNRTTKRFPSARKVAQQQTRDFIKAGICSLRGIHLRIVYVQDLSIEGMRRKIGDLLPLRGLEGHEPLIEYLELVGRSHEQDAKRW